MGAIEQLQGDRIYVDTNVWIYAMEGVDKYADFLATVFESDMEIVTSELAIAESLVAPIRAQDVDKQNSYMDAIANVDNTTAIPINRRILLEAARVRSYTKLKLPDAIHAATALATNCTTFLTNDKQFRTVEGLSVLLLQTAVGG